MQIGRDAWWLPWKRPFSSSVTGRPLQTNESAHRLNKCTCTESSWSATSTSVWRPCLENFEGTSSYIGRASLRRIGGAISSTFRSIGSTSNLMYRESLDADRFFVVCDRRGGSAWQILQPLGKANVCLRLCNKASGPEIVYFENTKGLLLQQNRLGQVGEGSPPPLAFPLCFAVGWGLPYSKNKRFPTLKYGFTWF